MGWGTRRLSEADEATAAARNAGRPILMRYNGPQRQNGTGRVNKALRHCDRTHGYRTGHYSREDVLAACHAAEGGSHE